MNWKNLIKATIFIILFIKSFSLISNILTISSNNYEYKCMTAIYQEPENSLDAVYLGSSNCYTFWNHNLAWGKYGITVTPYCCPAQPLFVAEYLIKEARKTQPNALYIVNINTLSYDTRKSDIIFHFILDYMPLSLNKLQLTNYLTKLGKYSFSDSLEFYLPIITYHSRWNELTKYNFTHQACEVKAGNTYKNYLTSISDNTNQYKTTDKESNLNDDLNQSILSLLDYCDEENVNILFVTVPRAEQNIKIVEKINTINRIVSQRGYPILNLMNSTDEIGISKKTDYSDKNHTNIHGSLKFTYYLSEYLIANYGFQNKQTNELYSSWNNSYDAYYKKIAPYVLDIELDSKPRNYNLPAPKNLKVVLTKKNAATITWSKVPGADGYLVYRKVANSSWSKLNETNDTFIYDAALKDKTTYTYTVVPYNLGSNGEPYYGNFSYKGVSSNT